MALEPSYVWLAVGVIFLAAEAMGVSGIGLWFAGLAALTTGIAGSLMPLNSTLQFIVFFLSTAVWAVALWKPMQKFRMNKNARGYSNMIGETGIVGSGGLTKKSGEVIWSGTTMTARLAPDAGVESLAAGTEVSITEVTGVTLIVKPR